MFLSNYKRKLVIENILHLLFTGKYNLHPVVEDGRLQDLTLTEVEMLCGYDPQYTGNLGLTKKDRLQLLGNAFSINAFCALLQSLKMYFKPSYNELKGV